MLLINDVVYADGLTPEELAAFIRNYNNVTGFWENDLEK